MKARTGHNEVKVSRSTVIDSRLANLNGTSSPAIGVMAWFIGALLAAALVGLLHDRGYANAKGLDSAEAGRGLETKAVNESGVSVASPVRLAGMGLLLSAGAICAATMPRGIPVRLGLLSLLVGLAVAWSAASWTWSIEQATTARELIRLMAYIAVSAAIARRFDLRQLFFVLTIMLTGSVLVSVGNEVLTGGFRPWQSDYRLTGSLHSNAVGIQSGVVAIIAYVFAVRGRDRRLLLYAIFCAAVTVLVLTKTRTALITVVTGMVTTHLIGRPAREWLFYVTSASSLVAIGILAAAILNFPFDQKLNKIANLGRSGEDVGSLTGRVPLWGFIWEETEGRRFQGVGYGAFWTRDRTHKANAVLRWYPRQSHSAYLDVIANIGFIGLAIGVSITLVATIQSALLATQLRVPEYCALAALLSAAFVNGLTETAFAMPRDIGIVVGALVFNLILRPALGSTFQPALDEVNGVRQSAGPFVASRHFPPRLSTDFGAAWPNS